MRGLDLLIPRQICNRARRQIKLTYQNVRKQAYRYYASQSLEEKRLKIRKNQLNSVKRDLSITGTTPSGLDKYFYSLIEGLD